MKLAVSNIAWAHEDEAQVAKLLHRLGLAQVEIAPTKVFADPTDTSAIERREYSQFWADNGIKIIAFQSLLFGRTDLTIFGDVEKRQETIDILSRLIELAGSLGATKLVFGSPKNRIVPDGMPQNQVQEIAENFFTALGSVATDNGTCFCIEPNPVAYGCNFVTTAAEGLKLVTSVNNPGFGLHLDTAGMTLAGDNIPEAVRAAGRNLKHFHASAPFLGQLEDVEVDHAGAAYALRDVGYEGSVSIEMRQSEPRLILENVSAAVELARFHYGA